MNWILFVKYLAVMSLTTYLVRTIPFLLFKKEIKSPFWKSFLAYIPYTILASMTVPAIFFATESRLSGILALVIASVVSCFKQSLILVALAASLVVLIIDGLIL